MQSLLCLRHCTLATLGPRHAYAIATRLEQVSDELLKVNQGTLYPALVRLEQNGWVKGTWGKTESNREAIESPGRGNATMAANGRGYGQAAGGGTMMRDLLTRTVAKIRNLLRDQRGILWLEQTRQDLRQACRTFARNPGFALVAIATLAVGVGVNTAAFTAYDAVALKPLPVGDPAEVVRLERWFTHGWLGDMQYGFSWPEYQYCREHQDVFSDVVATSRPVRVLAQLPGDQARTQLKALQGQMISGNYFRTFGVESGLGRTFGSEEDRAPGGEPVIVLSYSFWQRTFHGNPKIVGSVMRINGTAYSILGITPEEFTGTALLPQVPDFWAPASMQAQLLPGQDWLHQPADYRFQILGQ